MNMLAELADAIDNADEDFVSTYPGDPLEARNSPKWSEAIARAVMEIISEEV